MVVRYGSTVGTANVEEFELDVRYGLLDSLKLANVAP